MSLLTTALAAVLSGIALQGAPVGDDRAPQPLVDKPPAQIELAQFQQSPAFKRPPANQSELQLSLAPVAKKAAPAVVNIYTAKVLRNSPMMEDPVFRRFFGDGAFTPRERVQSSLGSGVIVRENGVIVTNNHVVEGADALKVVLSDRREFPARILAADQRTDLAVLKIDTGGERLPSLVFSDTTDAEVGDLVLAIGNPFGVGQTVTSGIISALARSETGISDFSFFVQTDAAINPGNSGGALVDINGRLVGINTAIFSRGGGSNGIGFAIPSELVRRTVDSTLSEGRIVRSWIGAKGQAVTSDLARALGLDRPTGVLIANVFPSGPAERAGLNVGDVVLSIDGQQVVNESGLLYIPATKSPGSNVRLEVLNQNRQRRMVDVRVDALPRTPGPERTELTGRNPFDGLTVFNLSPAAADDAGVDPFATGVYVGGVRRGSFGQQAGFRPGDVVREVNGRPIRTVGDLRAAINQNAARWRVAIDRRGQRLEADF